jgi:hypothetical protein
MELNLDDEYYQKYMKYKQRYHMLKQLKNNNELEGGGVIDMIRSALGYKTSQQKLEEEERTNQAAEEAVAAEAAANTETYLVFHFPAEFSDQELREKIIKQFRRVESRTSAIETLTSMINPEQAGKEIDIDLFFSLKDFYTYFTDGYVITANIKEGKSQIKYINEKSQGMTIEFDNFINHINYQKNKLNDQQYIELYNGNTLMLKYDEQEQEQEGGEKDDGEKNDGEEKKFSKVDSDNLKILNDFIDKKNTEIKASIGSYMNKLSGEFTDNPTIKDLQKFSYQPVSLNFRQNKGEDDKSDSFVKVTREKNGKQTINNTFWDVFKFDLEGAPSRKPNIILHVKIDDENIYIDEFKLVTTNDTYISIRDDIIKFDKASLRSSTSEPAA